MKGLFPFVLIVLSVSAFGQKGEAALGTYSENGKMIAITNLSGLSDCAARSARGKVRSVKVEGGVARVRLREKKVETDIEIPLDKLAKDERDAIFKQLVKKKNLLRVAGYACTPEAAIMAFSIDRLY